jgi:hypothetical protein
VPGKDLFAKFNAFLMEEYDVSLSPGTVVRHFGVDEVPVDMRELVQEIDRFGESAVTDA